MEMGGKEKRLKNKSVSKTGIRDVKEKRREEVDVGEVKERRIY